MNYVHIAGHMVADAETRFTANGQKVTTLRMATNSKRGGKEETIWWRVTLWGDRFDKLLPYLKKGSALIVVGEMHKPELYTDKEGRQQISNLEVTAEFVRFSPFGKGERGQEGGASAQSGQQQQAPFEGQNAYSFAGGGQQTQYGQKQEQSFDDDEMVPF
jgi:single-strand DNA-binding protein